MGLLGHANHLLFESGAPCDPILFFFLDVLDRHVGGVIQKGHESLHELLAENSGFDTTLPLDLLVDEALGAEGLARLIMEHLLGAVVRRAHRELFVRPGHRCQIRIARCQIDILPTCHSFYFSFILIIQYKLLSQ